MLRPLAAFVCGASAAASLLLLPGAAAADPPGGGQSCDPYTGTCTIVVTQPGDPGTSTPPGSDAGSGGGTDPGCHWGATVFPCSDTVLGWFDNDDGCYYRPADPQPPAGDSAWDGHSPGDGTVYTRTCMGLIYVPMPGGGRVQPAWASTVWLAQPPPGSPVLPPTAATLAQRALARLQLPTLTAASNGGATQTSYVGVPTWLWVDPAGWRSLSATAAVGTRSVTLTATPVAVTWSLGEGDTVRCNGPGTPFRSSAAANPPCGYTYRVSSAGQQQTGAQSNERFFAVQGSVDFALHWVCTGDCDQTNGDLADVARPTTAVPLRILEIQALVVNH